MLNGLVITTLASSALILLILALSPLIDRFLSSRVKYAIWLVIAVRMLFPYIPAESAAQVNIPLPEEMYVIADSGGISLGTAEESAAAEGISAGISDIVLAVWMIGAVSFFTVNLLRYLMFRRGLKPYMIPVEKELGVIDNSKRFRRLRLYRCEKVSTPMLMGLIKPTVLIPDIDYSEDELKMVIEHEAEHFRRRDILYKFILAAVNAMYFFDPLVYLMVRDANDNIEYVCDENICVDRGEDYRTRYSLMLLNAMRGKRPGMLITGLSSAGRAQKRRFRNIKLIDRKKSAEAVGAGWIITILLALAVSFTFAFTGERISTNEAVIGGADGPSDIRVSTEADVSDARIYIAVADAVMGYNRDLYTGGECGAEGHIILGTEDTKDGFIVYALTSYGSYGFEGDKFVRVSGSGCVPAVIALKPAEENRFDVDHVRFPENGEVYSSAVMELLPQEYWDTALGADFYEALVLMERQYAESYLERTGRGDIEIG